MVTPAFAVPTLIDTSLSCEAQVARLRKNEAILIGQLERAQNAIARIEFNRPKTGKLTIANETLLKFSAGQAARISAELKATRIVIDKLLAPAEGAARASRCSDADSADKTVSDAEAVEKSDSPSSKS